MSRNNYEMSPDFSNYDLQNVAWQLLIPSCKIWSRSPRFAKRAITNIHFGVRSKKKLPSVESSCTIYSYFTFPKPTVESWPYGFLCKVRISRTKSLAIRKRHLSRDLTFGVVRRAFQTKGLLLAVDLEDGRVFRPGMHSPTLAVTTWLIVS